MIYRSTQSKIRPVAFSPIEGGLRSGKVREQAIAEHGFEVVRFPRYNGDPDKNVSVSEELLQATGGLLIDGHLTFGGEATRSQAEALLDRVDAANRLGKPVFTPNNWRSTTTWFVREELTRKMGSVPLQSASGLHISHILAEMHEIPTGPHEDPPYAAMRECLQTEPPEPASTQPLNSVRGEQ